MRKVAVIGAGIGGLALAIRLQSAGIDTVVLEARAQPGGCAGFRISEGFTFDAGPTAITQPDALEALWHLSGHEMAQDVTLLPVSPFFRLQWPDGSTFDYSNDDQLLRSEIARISPRDAQGYRRFLAFAERAYDEGYAGLARTAFPDARSMLSALPALVRTRAWRSVYSVVSGFVRDERLRQALSFQTLLIGGNPTDIPAVYALIHKMERDTGVWFARGGIRCLVAGMVTHFERLGGVLRLGDPVASVDMLGDRVTGVTTRDGFSMPVDALASNADVVHSYRDLLRQSRSARRAGERWARARYTPSFFALHLGLRGTFPDIPHHMALFGPRYTEWLADIFDHGVLPKDFTLYLHHPSATDPSVAPEGHSVIQLLMTVPNLGRFPADWNAVAPILEQRMLDALARVLPDARDRIVTKFRHTPRDHAATLHAYLGSGFGPAPTLMQSGWRRVHNRDDGIGNLFFVGAGTHPGAGIPAVVAGAKVTAELMLETGVE